MSDPCPVGLRGIVTSLNTPFDARNRIDAAGLRAEVGHVHAAGCVGMLVAAVAGEAASLEEDEVRAVVATVVGHAAGRLPAIVSVTHDDQAVRVARAAFAREVGAAGILCQPPAGIDADQRRALLTEVAAAGPELFMLQDLDWAGSGLPLDEIVALFEGIPTFTCLKLETVPAGPKYSAVLDATGGRLHVSGGWAVMQMLEALARGVHAFMPTELEALRVAIARRYVAGDVAGARALFDAHLPIAAFSNQHIAVSIRFHKQLRRARGLFATDACRPPVPAFDAVQQAEADRLIALALRLEEEIEVGEGT